MRYSNEAMRITTQKDFEALILRYNDEIKQLAEDFEQAKEIAIRRLSTIQEWEDAKNYCVIGNAYKHGNMKGIIVILRYPDGSQRDIRYESEKITEVRNKIKELKAIHTVDWSKFDDKFN